MADIEVGQTFIDLRSSNLFQGEKAKYFISMSCADCDGDEFVCFVMNTERMMEKYHPYCNKTKQKFIIPPNTFSFITAHTSIMLARPAVYTYEEMFAGHIRLLEVAPNLLCSQIKNCIDWNFIPPRISKMIRG